MPPCTPHYLYKCLLLAHNILQLKFNIFSGQILIKGVCIETTQEHGLDPDYHSVMTESAQCKYDLEEMVFKMKDLFKQ